MASTITDIGASLDSLDALAFQIVPEPSSCALLIGSLALLVLKVRTRHG